jgi:hypothetical protein
MENKTYLTFIASLALALVLLLAGVALAQNQGGGPGNCPVAGQRQGNQLCTGGPGGTCVVNPANNPNTRNCPAYGAGQSQKQKGRKGQGATQPGQTNPPATNNQ